MKSIQLKEFGPHDEPGQLPNFSEELHVADEIQETVWSGQLVNPNSTVNALILAAWAYVEFPIRSSPLLPFAPDSRTMDTATAPNRSLYSPPDINYISVRHELEPPRYLKTTCWNRQNHGNELLSSCEGCLIQV